MRSTAVASGRSPSLPTPRPRSTCGLPAGPRRRGGCGWDQPANGMRSSPAPRSRRLRSIGSGRSPGTRCPGSEQLVVCSARSRNPPKVESKAARTPRRRPSAARRHGETTLANTPKPAPTSLRRLLPPARPGWPASDQLAVQHCGQSLRASRKSSATGWAGCPPRSGPTPGTGELAELLHRHVLLVPEKDVEIVW